MSHMPFGKLTNYQLSLELQNTRSKYTEMLSNNPLQKELIDKISAQELNFFNCQYHDEESFNSIVRKKIIPPSQ